MARGNLLQGTAHGALGDVVFHRIGGEQVERVRVRSVANPRSDKQLYSRAVLSTITSAYKAGKDIFDHSFEGVDVGEASKDVFFRLNMPLLRQSLIADLSNCPEKNINACLMAPATTSPVPNCYQVSRGSLYQKFFQITPASAANFYAKVSTPSANEGELVKDYLIANGLEAGDIYTFLLFAVNDSEPYMYEVPISHDWGGIQKRGSFAWIRLQVRDMRWSVLDVENALISDVFEIVDLHLLAPESFIYTSNLVFSETLADLFVFDDNAWNPYVFAIIRSAENSGLRSTERMQWIYWNHLTGLSYKYILYAWQNQSSELEV